MSVSLSALAFLAHAVVEIPAAASFVLTPQRQLSPAAATPEVLLVLQNLGGLLVASVLASLVLVARGHAIAPSTRGLLALALGSYHFFPCRRAALRLRHDIGIRGPQGRTLGGPRVHLVVHLVCLALLVLAGLTDVIVARHE
ncbi:hypothetical protein CMQ_983 [Grosmannia clavigera kw1407]|uniref:Integral membrane protein n=1 Tax=Grosmannia clavigera (strain kw1407 / UAMH 11150) TaxID=655863 RepID=F0XBZ4_GROCL|nr:uncharacterized protein CMQ_983 [Grosmannia clavigera kw1407]EFX04055.1 hypothetical protein CMQ_983 [Grosmannia clavigera kw1407]